jgi:hypothetical protein
VNRTISAVGLVTWALLLPAHGADTPRRFDLICDVQETTSFHPGEISKYQRHLSVDMEANEYCIWNSTCARINKIRQVSDSEILLTDSDDSFMRLRTSIALPAWEWKSVAHIKEIIESGGVAQGFCKMSPFTPFPPSAKQVPD